VSLEVRLPVLISAEVIDRQGIGRIVLFSSSDEAIELEIGDPRLQADWGEEYGTLFSSHNALSLVSAMRPASECGITPAAGGALGRWCTDMPEIEQIQAFTTNGDF
jgi:hypothetical protein